MDPRHVYTGVARLSPDEPDPREGLWESTDGGMSWTHVSQEFPVRKLMWDLRNPESRALVAVSAASPSSVYWSNARGRTWELLGQVPGKEALERGADINALVVVGDRAIVATTRDGIWKVRLPGLND
jgi:hypothetical protein